MMVDLRCFFVNLVTWELHDNCFGEQRPSYVALLMGKAHTACLGRFLSCERLVSERRGAPLHHQYLLARGWSLFDLDKILSFSHFDTSKQISKKKACYHLARSVKKMVSCFLNREGGSLW